MIFPSSLIISPSDSLIQKRIKSLCRQLKNSLSVNNPDILLIGQDKPGTIKQIRQITKFFAQKPFQHHSKIAIIYHVDQLSLPAQNALLKTAEEPGPNNFLFLTASSLGQLLPTIISRCQVYNLTADSTANPAIPQFNNPTKALNFSQQQKKEDIPSLLQNQLLNLKLNLIQHPNIKTAKQIRQLATAINMIRHHVDPVSALDFYLLNSLS